ALTSRPQVLPFRWQEDVSPGSTSSTRILLHHAINLGALCIVKVINHSTKIYLCTRYDLFSRYTLVITMYCWQVSRTILKHWNIMIPEMPRIDRKSTRLNSSHVSTSYAVFCLKKKKIQSTSPK